MPKKPRIITETIAFLRKVARTLEARREATDQFEDVLEGEAKELAKRLNDYDARETRKDPSKRKAKRVKR